MTCSESEEERARWNQKYADSSHTSLDPDPFLLEAHREFVAPLFPAPGAALEVAGGAGRHAIWLAQCGWQVTLVDISEVGTAKASENAAACGVRLRVETADLLA
ncbi:MAG TPA: class I SAM-dependent methyltransferase [Terriglobales bacterium]|nr:class I SAM-dependent methyltransferase [Terriglobales bacterium]